MAFDDLRELLDEKPLKLPIGGKTYTIKACSADTWLKLHVIAERMDRTLKSGNIDDEDGTSVQELLRLSLGDTLDQMVAGGVSGQELNVAGYTAFFWHLGNEATAEQVWNAGKALASASPNRATRRAAAKTTTSRTPRATAASKKARTARS